jgi:hypothetical protein
MPTPGVGDPVIGRLAHSSMTISSAKKLPEHQGGDGGVG